VNRIDQAFKRLISKKETALIPFLTAGDPSMEITRELVIEMDRQGADIVELGLPFSDPLADGPTIQAASFRALQAGMNPGKFFELTASIRRQSDIPLVLMGYYNPVLRYGLEKFASDAASAGIDGTIIPDLPLEEAAPWIKACNANGLANILLVAPNTPDSRIKKIVKASKGFIYYVSVLGITGARTSLPAHLSEGLEKVKQFTKKPVAVGFGISRPEQVKNLSSSADGIIVGSAIVKRIQEKIMNQDAMTSEDKGKSVKAIGEFVGSLKKATQ